MQKIIKLKKKIQVKAAYFIDGLSFNVFIVDERLSYGRVQYKIKPAAGGGSAWKDENSLIILQSFAAKKTDIIY